MQRALLTEGQSVWCCKDCIGIIKEDTNATYEEIRIKVEAAAAARLEPLPEVTGESADPFHQKAEAAVEAAEAAAKACQVTPGESADPCSQAQCCQCLIA